MHNKKRLVKSGELASLFRHIGLLAFALIAVLIFNTLGFIYHEQIPLTLLFTFISVEWVYFQHRQASRH